MQDLTILIDDDLLAAAETVALEHGTTVSALVRDYLTRLTKENSIAGAQKKLADLMDSTTGRLEAGFRWNREDIYAERLEQLLSRHEDSGVRSRLRSK